MNDKEKIEDFYAVLILSKENEELKQRIDKAIEYIKHAQNYGLGTVRNPYVKGEDLLKILGGKE